MEQQNFIKAFELQKAGHYEPAKKLYEEILQSDSEQPDVLHMLGILHAENKNWHDAEEYLKKALIIKPKEALYYHHLALVYQQKGDLQQAKIYYTKALDIQPGNFECLYNYSLLLMKLNLRDESIATLEKCYHLNNNDQKILYALSYEFFLQNKIDSSKKYLEKLLSLENINNIYYKFAGNFFFSNHEYDKSIYYYKKFLTYHAEDIEVLNNIGACFVINNDDTQAMDYFLQAYAIDMDFETTLNNIASLFLKNERYDNAKNHYITLIKMHPESVEYLYNIAFCEMNLGQIEESLNHFHQALIINPEHLDSILNLAKIYLDIGKKDTALFYYKRANIIKPDDNLILYHIAMIEKNQEFNKSPNEYLKNLFDNYSSYYDKHIKEKLDLKVPSLFYKLLSSLNTLEYFHSLLDLGCGTGMVGETFHHLFSEMEGVDISQKMLNICKTKNLYENLYQEDILKFLEETTKTYHCITASDVFVYFGDLSLLLPNIAAHLKPSGILLFSTEYLAEEASNGYVLNETGRFSHKKEYLLEELEKSNLQCVQIHHEIIRKQHTTPVSGFIVMAVKK